MNSLTARQQEILDLIRRYLAEQGMPPTRAEIANELGFSSANAAEQHLKALARKGYIDVIGGRNRNIQLREPAQNALSLPLVGRVAAGAPLLAVENIERYFACAELFTPRADYLLRVRGDSMRDAGINDGDLLAVHRRQNARNGQIVVARLDDDVTVKRLEYRRARSGQTRLRLLPANPDYPPIDVDPGRGELSIEGIAVGVVRALQ